ncbi:hypothetical protein M9H77_29781 [Catharanthus roseus]|uniref:Uncharacterized protein n=1 Tax=Catharanthus roseus TaxID=4058 RepID=A0ACB9ZW74_CATRO|nr:hypothetical protein M9H77_29781 [Catharanthus roseus]
MEIIHVAQAYHGGYYCNQQGDKALDKIVWKVPSLKVATKIENQRKRIGFSKTNLPSSRSVVPKPQASIYKSWPKKEDTPKVTFKYHSKPKMEENGRLITNPTRCFKCNGVGQIAINCPTKRTFMIAKRVLMTKKKVVKMMRYDMNQLDMQEHQGVVTRAKAKELKIHKDKIEQEKFQGLNFVQDLMGLKL